MILILNKDENVVVALTNNGSPDSCPYYNDIMKEFIDTGASTYEFYVPSYHVAVNSIVEGGYVVREDLDGNYRMFQITQVTDVHAQGTSGAGGSGSNKHVYAEDAGLELINDVIRPNTYTNYSPNDLFNALLIGQRWQIGNIDSSFPLQTLQYSNYETILAGLQTAAKQYGGELRFRIIIKNNKVSGRFVDLIKQRGDVTHKRFTYSKDILSIQRQVDMTTIATALIGVGNNNLTFSSVTATKDTNGYDKPVNQDWVGDPDALQLYGHQGKHIFKTFSYQTDDANELLQKTWEQLQIQKNPSVTYTLQVALLERLAGIQHEKVRIGDTVYIIDQTFSPALLLQARVLELDTCFSDPMQDVCTIGNYVVVKSNISYELQLIQSTLLQKASTWDNASTTADAAQQSVDNLSSTVSDIDTRTQPAQMVNTVVYSGDFSSIMNSKADVQDISDMATGQMVTDTKNSTINYVDGRIDGVGGVNESINTLSSKLDKTASDVTVQISASTGNNLVSNSIGFAGTDIWTKTGTVNTIQNQELEQLGFGSGFTSNVGETGYIEQVINTQTNETYTVSMWIKKTVDNATDGYAGIEIWENGVKLAFIGKDSGQGVTNGYELGAYTFTTQHNQITIRVTFGTNASATITGLMANVGSNVLQWQLAVGEVYNTTIQMNLNGIKVINGSTGGYTIMSDQEFSGYANVNGSMTKVFTVNGDTTEVNKLQVDNEINMGSLKMASFSTSSFTGWVLIPNG